MKKMFILLLLITITYSSAANVKNAYIRLMPPMMKMTAGFLTIVNDSSKDLKLINVSSSLSNFTELHTHKLKSDGTAVMTQVKYITIKANSSYSLKKGADHIMFIDLKEKLKLETSHKVILYFDNGSKKEVYLEVKKL